jgi:YHS domain-containing protein
MTLPFPALLAAALLALPACAASPVDPVFAKNGVAIHGAEGRHVAGKKEFAHRWMGAEWRFATAENRDRFAAAPERYAPQYGGYCAYGLSKGYAVKTEPDAFSVVDGKLYLNYDRSVRATWEPEKDKRIPLADRNWPQLPKKPL